MDAQETLDADFGASLPIFIGLSGFSWIESNNICYKVNMNVLELVVKSNFQEKVIFMKLILGTIFNYFLNKRLK